MQTKSKVNNSAKQHTNTHLNRLIIAAMLSALAAALMFLRFRFPLSHRTSTSWIFRNSCAYRRIFSWSCLGNRNGACKNPLKICVKRHYDRRRGRACQLPYGMRLCCSCFPFVQMEKEKKHGSYRNGHRNCGNGCCRCILNAYLLLPAYAAAFKMPMEAFVQMGSAINPNIDGLLSFVILAVAPFNLVKGILVSILVFFLYKPLSRLIHSKI